MFIFTAINDSNMELPHFLLPIPFTLPNSKEVDRHSKQVIIILNIITCFTLLKEPVIAEFWGNFNKIKHNSMFHF